MLDFQVAAYRGLPPYGSGMFALEGPGLRRDHRFFAGQPERKADRIRPRPVGFLLSRCRVAFAEVRSPHEIEKRRSFYLFLIREVRGLKGILVIQ